jgi:transporter family protein
MVESWVVWAFASAVFAALTAIFAKIGVSGVSPDFATLIRTLFVAPLLAAIAYSTGAMQPLSSIAPRTWLFLGLSGAGTGLSWLCYFRALQLGPASRVAPVDKLSVVLVSIFAVAFLGERLDARQWMAIMLIGAGVILLAWD